MVKFNNFSNVENSTPQNSYTQTVTSTSQVLRRTQPELVLQKNFGFENCLWEENARLTFVPVVPRQATAMHLLPLENAARTVLLNDAIRGQKLFLFNLVDLVEGLDLSVKTLSLEEAGFNNIEASYQQQSQLLVKTLTANLHGIASDDFVTLSSRNSKIIVASQLVRVIFLISCGEFRRANQILGKLKGLLAVSTNAPVVSKNHLSVLGYNNLLRRKLAEEIFAGSFSSRNPMILRFVTTRMFGRVLTSSRSIKQVIWKRSTLHLEQTSATSRIQPGYFYSDHHLQSRENSLSFLYFLRRLEEKYNSLVGVNSALAERLLSARNYLLILAEERMHRQRQKNLLLTRPSWVRVIRRRAWRNLMVEALVRRAERHPEGRAALEVLYSTLSPLLTRNVPLQVGRILNSSEKTSNDVGNGLVTAQHANWRRVLRPQRQLFVGKKLVEEDSVYPLKGYSDLFSQITGREASVFFVNALSLTRFAFQGEGKGKSSQRFLQNIDREMVSRYKYVAVYIQDFVRVSFISLFLKKPTFLAQFMALQISKLPRNRKETKMLRFLIKVVKIFAAQRREVVGLRILFKGRVNRWRRTKQVIGEKGILPLQSLNSRIEFGFAKAVTRKGTLGIRIWICYNPVFRRELRNAFLDYFEYSQQLQRRSLHRFLSEFQPR